MVKTFKGLKEGIDFEYVGLPSRGECYPHKIPVVPIRYMTANDENLFASKSLWEKNQVGEELLKRLILDDEVDVAGLCLGDREALLLNIYCKNYGTSLITDDGETIDLNAIEIKPFFMSADNDGFFDYVYKTGRTLKFRYPTFSNLKLLKEADLNAEHDLEREYLKLTLKDKIPSNMNEDDISKLYRFINYTAPGLDTELMLGDSLFLRFE
ncbi:hypothetical protein [uncultured Bacteroides sp.]|uniref:T4 family baseplate hub assembly chaperone n=1 Tax=uncultured Bacteroides sp. TaxID=162156 RepID=UPI0025AF7BF4|nr:hypothetical protein [uncultured Bacteroides sp.]